MKISKIRVKVCSCCGAEFETRIGRALYCPSCSPVVLRARATLASRGMPGGPERVALAVENARRRMAGDAPTERRCVTCGKTFMGRGTVICCKECTDDGLDLLHEFSGWTNGWDVAKPERVEAVEGWRGRPVMGGVVKFRIKDAAAND